MEDPADGCRACIDRTIGFGAYDQYIVAEPATGTSVPYLPDGYEEETIDGAMYTKLGPTYYRPYYERDAVVYVVTKV